MKRAWTEFALIAVALMGVAACDSGTGPEASVQTDVAFRVVSPASSSTSSSGSAPALSIPVSGTNGTLELDEMHVIVAEFELDRAVDDACDDDESADDDSGSGSSGDDDSSFDDDCEKFEVPPAFVQLPLDGGSTLAVSAPVEPDTYDEVEFEIEDLDDDDDGESAAEIMSEIRSEFPDWPDDASLLVIGTFTPEGGTAVPFRVFFDAEVELELELDPPVTITADGDPTFTVELDPALWFTDGTGRVRDLSALDYDETGTVWELEVEVENGFTGVEFDD